MVVGPGKVLRLQVGAVEGLKPRSKIEPETHQTETQLWITLFLTELRWSTPTLNAYQIFFKILSGGWQYWGLLIFSYIVASSQLKKMEPGTTKIGSRGK